MAARATDIRNSPLTSDQASQVDRLARSLDAEQLSWVSGYLAGLRVGALQAGASAAPVPDVPRLTVLYGSETGNAERIAHDAAKAAAARGIAARVVDMADFQTRELRNERLLLLVTATHGEGTPPDSAADFYEFLHSRKAPRLEQLQFAVLALGDSSYEFFCKTGRDFDARLAELGAKRLAERVDCDVDFDEPAAGWLARALDAAGRITSSSAAGSAATVLAFPRSAAAPTPAYDRRHPFSAEVLENLVLNGRGSERETRHIELSIEGSGLDYEPGDVLGLVTRNRDEDVDELIGTVGLDPAEIVTVGGAQQTLRDALRLEYEITTLTPGFVRAWAERSGAPALAALLGDDARAALTQFMRGRWLIDTIAEHPVENLGAAELLGMLRRLQPREYSIASSHKANPGEAHLTVAAVRYRSLGRERYGVASTHLADRAPPGDRIDIYLRSNKHFRLPTDPDAAVIMIGPGTGVAPFRAFVQEREALGASGANWLFFGNPRFRTDFLYQIEWQRWLADGRLERLDAAFSRDQAEKIYVQHRLLEAGADVFDWLESGAHVYVCGDAARMAPEVHEALLEIVRRYGAASADTAAEYVRQMQRDGRYQRDVY